MCTVFESGLKVFVGVAASRLCQIWGVKFVLGIRSLLDVTT